MTRLMRSTTRQRFAAAVIAALVAPGGPTFAASSGCTAANSGAFNSEVAAAGSVTRRITLDAGDVLGFSAQSSGSASVALVSGSGAPQALIAAATGAAASFKAPQADDYSFAFTATPQGAASVTVTCNSAQSAAANAAFLARRKDLLSAQDPDRISIDRAPKPIADPGKPLASAVALDEQGNPRQVEFSVSLSELEAAAHPGKKPDPGLVDLWVEGRMQNYEASDADLGVSNGNLGILYLGTRTMLGPDILVGGLAQLDRGIESDTLEETRLAATGWMAGPYVSMKLGSGVVFDGRAAWGQTQNVVAGDGSGVAETDRQLVRAKVTGTRDIGGWKVAPSLGLVYLEDAVRDDASGATKAVGTGRVEILPEVSRRFQIDGDTFIEPRAGVGGFVGFDDLNALNPMITTETGADLHLKAEAGLAVGVKDGSSLEAAAGVESGSTTTPETWSGRLQLNVPLSR